MKNSILFAFIIGLAACQCNTDNNKPTLDVEAEKQAILKMAGDRFGRMMAAPTAKAMAEAYAENTIAEPVYLPQNDSLLVGREAIVEWGTWFFGTYEIAFGNEGPFYDEWIIEENLAVHVYEAKGHFIEKATGDSIRSEQKATDVFKKVNGEWVYASHMWNANGMDIPMFNPDCERETKD